MEGLNSIKEPHPLDSRWKSALLTLLGDEDPEIYEATRREIFSHGREALVWMEGESERARGLTRRRCRQIVKGFNQQLADNEFTAFCLRSGDRLNLEEACWMLCRTQFPEIQPEAYSAWIDLLAGELLDRVDFGAEPMVIFMEINRYLFEHLGYHSAAAGLRISDHYYLSRLLEEREGNSASLSLLYTFLALRLHLPVSLIYLPGYFLCRFQTPREEFFIDPCQKGRFLSKNACHRYLQHYGHSPMDDHLKPQSPRKALRQICSDLRRACDLAGEGTQSARIQRYLFAMSG